jgi:hypothetical protein
MDEQGKRVDLNSELGMSRRDLLRRGAIVGGTLLWVAPAIQSMTPKAFAQEGSPLCAACLAVTIDPPGPTPPFTQHITFLSSATCCDCIDAGGGDILAVVLCAISGDCTIVGGVEDGPC